MRASSKVPPLAAAVALIASLAGLCPAPPGLGSRLACARAQLVEGELRCDRELLEDVGELCEAAEPRALGPGDALPPAACVCAAAAALPLRELGLGCAPAGRMPPDQLAALDQPVNVNLASPAELASLPGIGPKLAERIVAGRPYAQVGDLAEVRGIGPVRLAALRRRVRISPARSR
ncbi:photosystem II complex extrinsic protein precursor U [Enhygromyxa salina]|uniref:Photosystem II complex extrinsic protein U n=1 Tax=Enhygromyxa salina TaxID=215803 RepID=A0A2S9XDS7_9BACT|nr:helix-hairpin-helix domain-containing protein [Enhygromyxa salina]PRP91015.1 photosystem II complex extrinsic protein precursor U [Enhygromyxa salina]